MIAEYINHMGDDTMVVNAARVSFAKHHDEFVEGEDDKLIRYLARNDHWTPFAHPQVQFRLTVPIWLSNQLKRHQIGFALNEVSRRYIDTKPEFDRIAQWNWRPSRSVKQGSAGPMPDNDQRIASDIEAKVLHTCEQSYNALLGIGVAPEQARSILPQSMLTSFYWTGSLFAWARLCRQRMDSHAQAENRVLATQISNEMAALFPVSWRAMVLDCVLDQD